MIFDEPSKGKGGNAFLVVGITIFCLNIRKQISTIIICITVALLLFPNNAEINACTSVNCSNYVIKAESDFIIDNHEIYIDLRSLEEFLVVEKITIRNPNNVTISSIDFLFDKTAQSLSFEDGAGNLSIEIVSMSETENLVTVNYREDMHYNTNITLDASYQLAESRLDERGKDFYRFTFYSYVSYYTINKSISVFFPYDCYLHREEDFPPIIPPAEAVFSGYRMFIEWDYDNLDPNDNQLVSVYFDYVLKKPPIWAFIVGPVLGVTAGVGGAYLFMRRRTKRTIRKLGDVFLTDTQKQFAKLILENDGKMLQKDLCDQTGFSKSNVSRTLIPLEEQGLIRREKRGRNFIVYLTEEGYKVIE